MSNISYSAIKTIFYHEIKDFFKEFQFNILAPLISTIIFVLIMHTIESLYSLNSVEGSYINFLIPGIVIMIVIQTSYSHLSEVIIAMKQNGSFDDYLLSPISRIELFISFLLSSIFVCFIIGIINLFILSFFTHFVYINYFSLLYYLLLTIIIFSSLGAITGLLSYTWDTQSGIYNFFITPISFFSGTFFPISSIDEKWQFIYNFNPFYYLVVGFRGSFLNTKLSFSIDLIILCIVFFIFISALFIFKKGYKIIN